MSPHAAPARWCEASPHNKKPATDESAGGQCIRRMPRGAQGQYISGATSPEASVERVGRAADRRDYPHSRDAGSIPGCQIEATMGSPSS
jgi:hypothetical protein